MNVKIRKSAFLLDFLDIMLRAAFWAGEIVESFNGSDIREADAIIDGKIEVYSKTQRRMQYYCDGWKISILCM